MSTRAPWILAIDQGTSGSTCLAVGSDGAVMHRAYREVGISYPHPGWVEQDPIELFATVKETMIDILQTMGHPPLAIGITNQRETIIAFHKSTLKPYGPAIVWQCKRSHDLCIAHKNRNEEQRIRHATGLFLDPYFAGTKMEWILAHNSELARDAETGTACIGTVDTWLIANLTSGKRFITDPSNASRTLLYDLRCGTFTDDLCNIFGVPQACLPSIVPSSGTLAMTNPSVTCGHSIPICGIAGDQQAALFGQGCVTPGMSKNTYGTGSFLLTVLDGLPSEPVEGLITTVAWRIQDTDTFACEGSVFTTGAVLKWLRDLLGFFDSYDEIGPLIATVTDSMGCYVVPSLSGFGAPWWNPDARGIILGLEQGTSRAHIVKAAVESFCYRTRDITERIHEETGVTLTELRIDGGATAIEYLCQFQSDVLNIPVIVAASPEATGRGAALLAGLGAGLFENAQEAALLWKSARNYEPTMSALWSAKKYASWKNILSVTNLLYANTQ